MTARTNHTRKVIITAVAIEVLGQSLDRFLEGCSFADATAVLFPSDDGQTVWGLTSCLPTNRSLAAAHTIPRLRRSRDKLNLRLSRWTDAVRDRPSLLRLVNIYSETRLSRRDWQIDAMTNLASSVVTSRRRIIAYWVTTALVVFELALGGVWDVLRVPQVRGLIERLGYPPYFLVILGIWKLLGAVALVIPRFPRLKEWAYAGVLFDLTGAVASLLASGLIDVGTMAYPIVMAGAAVASWALRPSSRRLGSR